MQCFDITGSLLIMFSFFFCSYDHPFFTEKQNACVKIYSVVCHRDCNRLCQLCVLQFCLRFLNQVFEKTTQKQRKKEVGCVSARCVHDS